MNCPGCEQEMAEQSFEGLGGKRVVLDVCHGCHGLWFDANESRQLTSLGTLHLFRELHGRRGEHRNRVARVCHCPRCRAQLAVAHDMAHNNRFQYSRCPQKHGHFIRFFQLLREKGFVRSLNLKELTELRKHVDTLQCSDCGSPIDLEKHSGCESCHAPISILDPRCVEETVKDAQEETGSRHNVAPEVAARLLMNNLRMDGFHRRPDARVAAATVAAAGVIPLVAQEQGRGRMGETAADVAEVAVDVAEVAVDVADLDLIDVGVGIVSSALESLGDLFSF